MSKSKMNRDTVRDIISVRVPTTRLIALLRHQGNDTYSFQGFKYFLSVFDDQCFKVKVTLADNPMGIFYFDPEEFGISPDSFEAM